MRLTSAPGAEVERRGVIESKDKALAIAKACSSKKALDIIIIDMRKMPSVSDYFVIASGTSTTQVKAIKDFIIKVMGHRRQRLWHVEGEREALWILLDYGDVVGHIFYDETRRFYCLERLWRDAPQKAFKEVVRKRKQQHGKKRISKTPHRRKKS